MTVYKLDIEEDVHKNFALLAIHSTLEPYKLAFLLNKILQTKLKREKEDFKPGNVIKKGFPLFKYTHFLTHQIYCLVSNKTTSFVKTTITNAGLFQNNVPLQNQVHYVVPQLKQVDFFLKINNVLSEKEKTNLQNKIKQIKQIQSVYWVENTKIKTFKTLFEL